MTNEDLILFLMVDPYWTIIPPLTAAYYHYHPLARGETNRGAATFWLTMLWSIRCVTFSYLSYCYCRDWLRVSKFENNLDRTYSTP